MERCGSIVRESIDGCGQAWNEQTAWSWPIELRPKEIEKSFEVLGIS